MTNREILVTVVSFIIAVFAIAALAVRFGAIAVRSLLIRLYDVIFRHKIKTDK